MLPANVHSWITPMGAYLQAAGYHDSASVASSWGGSRRWVCGVDPGEELRIRS